MDKWHGHGRWIAGITRRSLVAYGSVFVLMAAASKAVWAQLVTIFPGSTDLSPDAVPDPGQGGYLTATEKRAVSAVFDRLIPADALSPSATQCGCVEFLDRQLAGPFGKASATYRSGPFMPGTPEQGWQHPATPAERYRSGLAGLDALARQRHGAAFADLDGAQQDAMLHELEGGSADLGKAGDSRAFFELMLANVREGFLADPLYGGNRDMAGWKMIGFPGARYDFRDVIDKRGEKLAIEPVSLLDPERNA